MLNIMCMQAHREQKKVVTGDFKTLDVDARNQTWVISKSSIISQ